MATILPSVGLLNATSIPILLRKIGVPGGIRRPHPAHFVRQGVRVGHSPADASFCEIACMRFSSLRSAQAHFESLRTKLVVPSAQSFYSAPSFFRKGVTANEVSVLGGNLGFPLGNYSGASPALVLTLCGSQANATFIKCVCRRPNNMVPPA